MSPVSRKINLNFLKPASSLRAIPPAGSTLSPLLFFQNLFIKKESLVSSINERYPDHYVYLFNNAKSALRIALSAVNSCSGRNTVAMSAYTCPDVATAAIDADCRIALFDISGETLQPDALSILKTIREDHTGSIILSNLYGYPDSISIDLPNGLYVVNDACQSSLNMFNNGSVSISNEEITILSFGRGKAFSAAGGGMLLVPKKDVRSRGLFFTKINELIRSHYNDLPHGLFSANIFYALKLLLQWVFEKPYLFRIICSLPGTGIGKTKVQMNNPIFKADKAVIAAVYSSLKYIDKRLNEIHSSLLLYQPFLKTPVPQDISPVRIPVILPAKKREHLARRHLYTRKYGLSFSYPSIITDYPEIKPFVVSSSSGNNNVYGGAKSVSRSIVTLPLHKYVTLDDVYEISKLISEE
jgi:dTDP-4-amino-4,6-dideoxygalactose transaminase